MTRSRILKAHDVIMVKLDVVNASDKMRPRVNINSVPSTKTKN